MIEKIEEAVKYIASQKVENPQVGIVLGTGLGNLVKEIDVITTIDYADIPHFPVSTVESHSGKLIYGEIRGKKVLAMQGRFHYYEGYTGKEITFPIRVMKALKVEKLLISNAAGTVNPAFKKGSLMLLDDHINLLPDNPLRGKNLDQFGPRFPDMSLPYSAEINQKIRQIAEEEGIHLNEGVYVGVEGPNLETRAEYRYLRNLGADAVGMSTIPEVIVANHMSLPCAAISVLTDECDPDNLKPVSLQEILECAGVAEKDLTRIFVKLIGKL